jgi:hypothetical protein
MKVIDRPFPSSRRVSWRFLGARGSVAAAEGEKAPRASRRTSGSRRSRTASAVCCRQIALPRDSRGNLTSRDRDHERRSARRQRHAGQPDRRRPSGRSTTAAGTADPAEQRRGQTSSFTRASARHRHRLGAQPARGRGARQQQTARSRSRKYDPATQKLLPLRGRAFVGGKTYAGTPVGGRLPSQTRATLDGSGNIQAEVVEAQPGLDSRGPRAGSLATTCSWTRRCSCS